MSAPISSSLSDLAMLGQTLKANSERIVAESAAVFASAGRERAHPFPLDAVPGGLPLLLSELMALLPQAIAEGDVTLSAGAEKLEVLAELRLDVVIKALEGVSEVVVMELKRLEGSVAKGFLDEACRETRLFFDLKIAHYCQKFVAAQGTELTLHTRQLDEASERLAADGAGADAAAHSRVQLLQGVIHELRNTLQSVVLHATSVVDFPREAGVAEVMQRLTANGIRLQELLDRLGLYASLLAGEWSNRMESVDVGVFLQDLEVRHRGLARTASTRLTCRQTSGPSQIITDAGKLSLIADNLVTNAVHAAKGGLVQVEMSEGGTGRMLLTVTDNGHGIRLTEARHLFRVIHHVEGSKFSGLKLGLLASRHLAHLLGGELTFESEEGRGATFQVSFPRVLR
ncbi:sensor histidine kinase [Prosthecobacter sp.]|uniref:sensor histidine kinase n=1 Tax=Prosthecobacter sp. TaxID=1965333 RepID=UPI003785284E